MNLLFVGGTIFSDDFRHNLKQKGLAFGNASETFLSAILCGLNKYSEVRVITEFKVPVFPHFYKLFIKGEKFKHVSGSEVTSITYLNSPIFQRLSKAISYYKIIKRQRRKDDVIVIYEVSSRTLIPTLLANKSNKVIIIVPDLPEFMSDNTNPLYKIAKSIDLKLIRYYIKKIDGFVLLSPYMQNRIDIGNRPSITIEGIFNTMDIVGSKKILDKKVVLYTGKIEKWFGLEDLFKAFMLVKENCELWLCGPGDDSLIHNYCSKDSRIKYLGSKTHEEVLKIQKQVYLLVNPRHSSDEFTMYSFPSKTMEYMASGTPTLMCRLKSLPEEYYPHLYFFEDESIEGMANTIEYILHKSSEELNKKGKDAADFIIKEKNSSIQSSKIINFIEKEIL